MPHNIIKLISLNWFESLLPLYTHTGVELEPCRSSRLQSNLTLKKTWLVILKKKKKKDKIYIPIHSAYIAV